MRNTSTVGSYRARADGIGADTVASVEEGDAVGQADEVVQDYGFLISPSAFLNADRRCRDNN